MASTKVAFLAVVVLLLQVSSPAETQEDGFPAVMSLTNFEQDGGDPAACDERYHNNRDPVVALSTKWYAGGSLCQRSITIRSDATGRTAGAVVVDECDAQSGCPDNMVATSQEVWDTLGEDVNNGEVSVFWSFPDA